VKARSGGTNRKCGKKALPYEKVKIIAVIAEDFFKQVFFALIIMRNCFVRRFNKLEIFSVLIQPI